jgi:hypothetical protein
MFTVDSMVDTIQNSKKQFVNIFVQNKVIAQALNDFVDAQSEYTKNAFKTNFDAGSRVTQELVRSATELTKFDYSKFGEGIMKAYGEINRQTEKMARAAYSKKTD